MKVFLFSVRILCSYQNLFVKYLKRHLFLTQESKSRLILTITHQNMIRYMLNTSRGQNLRNVDCLFWQTGYLKGAGGVDCFFVFFSLWESVFDAQHLFPFEPCHEKTCIRR